MANEKRLIDANDALERLKKADREMKVVSLCGCKAVPMDGVIDFVASRPTVDAVEVVRCANCAVPHNKWTGCPKLSGLVPPPDFYCAFGERKDNG